MKYLLQNIVYLVIIFKSLINMLKKVLDAQILSSLPSTLSYVWLS